MKETAREIARGAEAVIYEDKEHIIKLRPKKSYRIPEIDEQLRKRRTKKEASVLDKLSKQDINVPKLIETDNKERIVMEKIEGKQVKLVLDSRPELATKIGKLVVQLHSQDIVHSDLTTSNMILKDEEVYLIDFGLSFHSTRIEDKAVDIHLFLQALESRHYKVKEKAFKHFQKAYASYPEAAKVMQRLKTVEARGRYKKK